MHYTLTQIYQPTTADALHQQMFVCSCARVFMCSCGHGFMVSWVRVFMCSCVRMGSGNLNEYRRGVITAMRAAGLRVFHANVDKALFGRFTWGGIRTNGEWLIGTVRWKLCARFANRIIALEYMSLLCVCSHGLGAFGNHTLTRTRTLA
jgi:hypothetical protein